MSGSYFIVKRCGQTRKSWYFRTVLCSLPAPNVRHVMIFSVMFKALLLELPLSLWRGWWSLTPYSRAGEEVRNFHKGWPAKFSDFFDFSYFCWHKRPTLFGWLCWKNPTIPSYFNSHTQPPLWSVHPNGSAPQKNPLDVLLICGCHSKMDHALDFEQSQ